MRVTEAARFDLLRRELGRTSSDMARVSERLATGRAINRLSDDPELAVHADRLLVEDKALMTYAKAADNARAWLGTQDGTLQTASAVMRRVRELTISAGAPLGPAAREGIAIELEGIRDQLIDTANTTFNGRPVFGGFGSQAVQETAGVVVFVGDAGAVERRISENRTVQVNISAGDAFGFNAGDDVFTLLSDVIGHVRAGDSASISTTDLTRIADAESRIGEALGAVGARGNQVSNTLTSGQARRDEIRAYRSSIVDADLASTALEMTMAETSYESVLAATSRLQLPNLADYLR
jgi:flagellar hook-associated protein 3 FlgL